MTCLKSPSLGVTEPGFKTQQSGFGVHTINVCKLPVSQLVEQTVGYMNLELRGIVRAGDSTFIFLKRKPAFVPHLSVGWQWRKKNTGNCAVLTGL